MSHNPWTQRRPVDFVLLIIMPTIMRPIHINQYPAFSLFSLQNNTDGTGARQWRRQERPFWQMKYLEAAEVSPADIECSRVCSNERPMDLKGMQERSNDGRSAYECQQEQQERLVWLRRYKGSTHYDCHKKLRGP